MSHKPALIFLAGWSFKASVWETVGKHLADYAIHYCDLPLLSKTGNDLVTILNHLKLSLPDNSIIIGWSLGGALGALLCHLYPQQFCKLVTLSSTPHFISDGTWQGANEHDAAKLRADFCHAPDDLLERFRRWVAFPDHKHHHSTILAKYILHDVATLTYYLDLLLHYDFRPTYQHLSLPVYHLYGDRDVILSPQLTTKMRADYPQHTHQVIANAGHAALLSHPVAVATHIRQFIETTHA